MNMKKTFLKKGLREVWAHKVQYFLLALVIGLGVAAYSSFNDFSRLRGDSLDAIYSESLFMDMQVQLQYGAAVNRSFIEDLMGSPSLNGMIEDLEARLSFEVFINHTDGDVTRTTKGLIMGYELKDGRTDLNGQTVNRPLYYVDDVPAFSNEVNNECYLERKYSKAYDLTKGSSITVIKGLRAMELTVLEQTAVPEYFYVVREGSILPEERSFGVICVPLVTAMGLFFDNGTEPLFNDLVLTLKDKSDIDGVKELLRTAFESKGIPVKITKGDDNPSRYFLINDYENDKQGMGIFPIIIWGVSAFGLVMALRRMIRTHRPQIGVFKALGIPDRAVLIYFGTIGTIVAVLGTFMGWLLSIPLNRAFISLLDSLLDFPLMEYGTTWSYYVLGLAIALLLCWACTVIPAFFALRVRPIDVIQSREGLSKKRVGKLSGSIGRSSTIPVSIKLTARNILRKPGRSISTALGVGISLGLFLSIIMVLEVFTVVLDTTTEGNLWTYEVQMDRFVTANSTEVWTEEHRDIASVNPGMFIPTQLGPSGDEEGSVLYAMRDPLLSFKFEMDRGSFIPGKLVISSLQADKLSLSVGDSVEVMLPVVDPVIGLRMERMQLEVSGIQGNHFGPYCFSDLQTIQTLTGLEGMANLVHIRTDPQDRNVPLENALITTSGVSSVTNIDERKGMLDQYFDLFVSSISILGLVSTALAGAIVYTMFKISAEEKERDYATMKTLGATMTKVSRLISLEALFVIVSGMTLGVLFGFIFANLMLRMTGDDYEAFNLTIRFSNLGFFLGSIMILGVVILVSLMTLRYISRINIANVIRERSMG